MGWSIGGVLGRAQGVLERTITWIRSTCVGGDRRCVGEDLDRKGIEEDAQRSVEGEEVVVEG